MSYTQLCSSWNYTMLVCEEHLWRISDTLFGGLFRGYDHLVHLSDMLATSDFRDRITFFNGFSVFILNLGCHGNRRRGAGQSRLFTVAISMCQIDVILYLTTPPQNLTFDATLAEDDPHEHANKRAQVHKESRLMQSHAIATEPRMIICRAEHSTAENSNWCSDDPAAPLPRHRIDQWHINKRNLFSSHVQKLEANGQ